jgi:hypothetical protein
VILDIGGVHLGTDQQTASIGHNVALAAFDLLGRIVPPRRTALGRLDRLAYAGRCHRHGRYAEERRLDPQLTGQVTIIDRQGLEADRK